MVGDGDESLYEKLLIEPEPSFRRLYDRYSGPLYRFIFRFTANAQSAEEILHDIFLELLNGKFQPRKDGSLKSWLFTLAKNKGLNFSKKHSHRGIPQTSIEETASPEDLEAQMIEKNLLRKLDAAERFLPEELNAPWNLRKQGHDYQEIAMKLSIPIGTVKSRFHRLVEFMRKELENE